MLGQCLLKPVAISTKPTHPYRGRSEVVSVGLEDFSEMAWKAPKPLDLKVASSSIDYKPQCKLTSEFSRKHKVLLLCSNVKIGHRTLLVFIGVLKPKRDGTADPAFADLLRSAGKWAVAVRVFNSSCPGTWDTWRYVSGENWGQTKVRTTSQTICTSGVREIWVASKVHGCRPCKGLDHGLLICFGLMLKPSSSSSHWDSSSMSGQTLSGGSVYTGYQWCWDVLGILAKFGTPVPTSSARCFAVSLIFAPGMSACQATLQHVGWRDGGKMLEGMVEK